MLGRYQGSIWNWNWPNHPIHRPPSGESSRTHWRLHVGGLVGDTGRPVGDRRETTETGSRRDLRFLARSVPPRTGCRMIPSALVSRSRFLTRRRPNPSTASPVEAVLGRRSLGTCRDRGIRWSSTSTRQSIASYPCLVQGPPTSHAQGCRRQANGRRNNPIAAPCRRPHGNRFPRSPRTFVPADGWLARRPGKVDAQTDRVPGKGSDVDTERWEATDWGQS